MLILCIIFLIVYAFIRSSPPTGVTAPSTGSTSLTKQCDIITVDGLFCDKRGFCCSDSIVTRMLLSDRLDNYTNKSLVISIDNWMVYSYADLDSVKIDEYQLKRDYVKNPIRRDADIQCGRNYTVSIIQGGLIDWTQEEIKNRTIASVSFRAHGRLVKIVLTGENNITLTQVDPSCDACFDKLDNCKESII